VLGLS